MVFRDIAIKLIKAVLYIGYIVAILSIIFLLCIRKYKKDLLPKQEVLSQEEINISEQEIGWNSIFPEKKQRHERFEERKEEGVIRVGLMGDSFVEGVENADGYSIAAQLQEILNKQSSGEESYEVLNFGVSGHGLHQQGIGWENFASKKNLDYVVFVQLTTDWIRRDLSFASLPNFLLQYSEKPKRLEKVHINLHSRYILKDDKIQKVNPLGQTQYDRFKHYWSAIPKKFYLKYDNSTPLLIRALNYCFTAKSGYLRSPFYYYGDEQEEQNAIRKQILEMIAKKVDKVFYIAIDENLLETLKSYQISNLEVIKYNVAKNALYKRPAEHLSAIAYRNLAGGIADRLMGGGKQNKSNRLRLLKIKHKLVSKSKDYKTINADDKIYIEIGENKFGSLYDISYANDSYAYCKDLECNHDINTLENVKSILYFKNLLSNTGHMLFIGLSKQLGVEDLYWQIDGSNKKIQIKRQVIAEGIFEVLDGEELYKINKDKVAISSISSLYSECMKLKAKSISLYLGKEKILTGQVSSDGIKLSSVKAKFLSISGLPSIEDEKTNVIKIETMYLNFYRDRIKKLEIKMAELEWSSETVTEVLKEATN